MDDPEETRKHHKKGMDREIQTKSRRVWARSLPWDFGESVRKRVKRIDDVGGLMAKIEIIIY